MYSPAIRADLIKRLYQEKKRRGIAMTKLVNQIVESALKDLEAEAVPAMPMRQGARATADFSL